MLTALSGFLRGILGPGLYGGAIAIAFYTLFKRVEIGFYLLFAMLPQPNVWYRLHLFPYGKEFVDIFFFCILFGIMLQRKDFTKTGNSVIILIFLTVSYLSLINSSARFSLPFPVTLENQLMADWKNYAEMILFYFLALNVIRNEKQRNTLIVLMTLVILLVAFRSFRSFSPGSSFSYAKRTGGPFEIIGLGPNHFGSFMVDYVAVLVGLFLFDDNRKRKLLYIAAILFSLHPIFFSYSRGAYLSALVAIVFMGLIKKRSLLVLSAVVMLSWQTLLPVSVVDRIMMTETPEGEIEHSAASRLALWDRALAIFDQNPVFGIGFGGFSLSSGGEVMDNGDVLHANQDVHNFYMRTLCEQGVIGISLFLLVLFCSFRSGWQLYRVAKVPLNKGLGFGFMGCVVAVAVSNLFGDRWSYQVLGSYFWMLWGVVDSTIRASKEV